MLLKRFFGSAPKSSQNTDKRGLDLNAINLQRHYRTVRTAFYPCWSDGIHWQVRLIRGESWAVRCDRTRRLVSVNGDAFDDRDDLRAALVQQLAYAATFGRPADAWYDYMTRSIVSARRLGHRRLARRIDKIARAGYVDELEVYFDPRLDTLTTYRDGSIHSRAGDGVPEAISFEDSLRFSILEREIKREEAELRDRRKRRELRGA